MLETLLKSLNIDPLVLLYNGILFLVLLQALSFIFWKPMMRHLAERRSGIDSAYRAVDATRREMENLRSEYQARLAQIEAEARGKIQETVRDAQKSREDLIAQARAQAEETISKGAESIEQEKASAVVAMRKNLDEAAESVLARVLRSPADSAQSLLIDEYIADKVVRS